MLTGRRYVASVGDAPSALAHAQIASFALWSSHALRRSCHCYLRRFRSGPHTVRPGGCRLPDCCACCNCWPGACCTGLSRVGVLRLTLSLFLFSLPPPHSTHTALGAATNACVTPSSSQTAYRTARWPCVTHERASPCVQKTQPPFRKPFFHAEKSALTRCCFHMYPQVCWGAHLLRERLHLPWFLCSAAKVLRHRCSHAIRLHLGQ